MDTQVYLGIDIGSVTCKFVLVDEREELVQAIYRRTHGRVIEAIKNGMTELAGWLKGRCLAGCTTTGSARHLAAALIRADLVKNEITTHAIAGIKIQPDVRTILEIGGEDSKIILIRNGVPVDFAMNTMCAAGTGAFLDQLAGRLHIPVEQLGEISLKSKQEVAMAGRCTVFAESDLIFKQQVGCRIEDIVHGLCNAMVRNYLNDVGKGKDIQPRVFFLGGVAANTGIRRAFVEALGMSIEVPPHAHVMGAYGAALVARRRNNGYAQPSCMKSVAEILTSDFATRSFVCHNCNNHCEVVVFKENGKPVGFLGGRCGRWIDKSSNLSPRLSQVNPEHVCSLQTGKACEQPVM